MPMYASRHQALNKALTSHLMQVLVTLMHYFTIIDQKILLFLLECVN